MQKVELYFLHVAIEKYSSNEILNITKQKLFELYKLKTQFVSSIPNDMNSVISW